MGGVGAGGVEETAGEVEGAGGVWGAGGVGVESGMASFSFGWFPVKRVDAGGAFRAGACGQLRVSRDLHHSYG